MKPRLITYFLLATLIGATPVLAQSVYLQDIDIVFKKTDSRVVITLNGMMPSPCFNVVPFSMVEDHMVTVSLEIRFPEGVSTCLKETAPFKVSSMIDTPPPGEYEVQVTINGQMQVQYRHFNVAEEVSEV